jgi:BirA family biotin operon repressor/biotin-[acetyl-CoA-carboxylase] ligase
MVVVPDLASRGGRWHTHEHHGTVGSTNDLALAAVAAGTRAGLVVTADRQTAGRGRRGRTWEDRPDGASLATSVTLATPGAAAQLLPLVAGLAAVEALDRHDVPASLKWPNDVQAVVDGRPAKLAGILAEAVAQGVVVGIGWNVDLRATEPVDGATSAAQVAGHDVDRWRLFADHLRALDGRLADLEAGRTGALVVAYRERCATLGRQVTAHVDGGQVVGRAVDVALDGALVLAMPDGRTARVTSGEVVHLR